MRSDENQRPRGRPPALTSHGRAWAIGGGALLLVGVAAGSPEAAALGVLMIAALSTAYLAFFPAAVYVWRRHLELSWRLEQPDAGYDNFVVGRPFQLVVLLRNRAPRPLGRVLLRVFASSALDTPEPISFALPPVHELTARGEMVARQAGTWHLHGAAVELTDPLGLSTVEAYFPNPLAVKVFPRREVRGAPILPRPTAGAPHERLGLHALRVRGLGGDLRELREHAPGDPFKHIAWKATARTGRLMVRDLDRETMVTHHLLVDVGPSMRSGAPGSTRLDYAIDLASSYARAALEAGDRVGLLTYDGRIVAEVKPNDGPVHRLRLYEPLLAATRPVDDDLTEVTDSELVAQVARYLVHQEGLDARLLRTPPIDDPAWAHLAATPTGELYDLRVVLAAVDAALKPLGRLPPARAATPELERLRQYCLQRGIELPTRRTGEAGRRARGLKDALERAAAGRGAQRILVISDLDGLERGLPDVQRAVRLARRRGHHLVCAAPSARLFGLGRDEPQDEDARALAEIHAWELARRERAAFARLAALGVRVIPVGPGDSAAGAPTKVGRVSGLMGRLAPPARAAPSLPQASAR